MEEGFEVGVGVDDGGLVLHEAPGVGGGAVGAVEAVVDLAEEGRLLAAVVGGVGDAAGHDPGAGAAGLEEVDFLLPPGVGFGGEDLEAEGGVVAVEGHEIEARFGGGQGRVGHDDAEHAGEPEVLADGLVDHLFEEVAAAAVGGVRARVEVGVVEHGPDAEYLLDFRAVGVDKEGVSGGGLVAVVGVVVVGLWFVCIHRACLSACMSVCWGIGWGGPWRAAPWNPC